MKFIRLLPLVLAPLVFSTAAAPVAAPFSPAIVTPIATPLRDRIIADASALPPERLAFDRATNAVRTGGGTTNTTRITDTWNGRQWSLITTQGHQPSASERSDHQRTAEAIPVPGYYQLGAIIAAATGTSVDPQGRTLLLIPKMPADSVRTDTGDISEHMQGEARLARRGDQVWVDQLHVTAREPFKLTMLIKVLSFEQTSEYAPGIDGKPRLTIQKSESKGSMFGFPGGEKAQASFVYR